MTELLKWWDVLDFLEVLARRSDVRFQEGLQMARECQHEDAKWLTSLLPADTFVTMDQAREVMLAQGEDARALFFAWLLEANRDALRESFAQLRRAAEMGYAPAQAALCAWLDDGDPKAFLWAEKAAAQGFRKGLWMLGEHFAKGRHCERDLSKAIGLYREAAELGDACAQLRYGACAFGELDWERYHWWGRATVRKPGIYELELDSLKLLDWFEERKLGRALFEVAPGCKARLHAHNGMTVDCHLNDADRDKLQRIVALFKSCCARARQGIDCWSIVGRRLNVVKDIRVTIAKMAWGEAWRWAEEGKEVDADARAPNE